MILSPNLAAPGIAHGFFGRKGGVSAGIYASLNCGSGSGDNVESVRENRALAMKHFGLRGTDLVTLHQIHSDCAVSVIQPWGLGQGPQADAMATNVPGIALGVLAADCAPVLFADAETRVIAAAHAGWKGALAGVIESAVAEMEKLGAKRARIACAIGPCIGLRSYEVGPEFRERFLRASAANVVYFEPGKDGRFHFDLPQFCADRARALKLASVETIARCTYAEEDAFFSYRRATHRGESDYGRNLSAIALRP